MQYSIIKYALIKYILSLFFRKLVVLSDKVQALEKKNSEQELIIEDENIIEGKSYEQLEG